MTVIKKLDSLENYELPKNNFLITDSNLDNLYAGFTNKFDYKFVIEPGEHSKDLNVISKIIQTMLQKNLTTETTIVAFGGGVVSDITGFVASIYKRGIKFETIATTIMSLDAAIGGKNGVDFNGEKNMIGTFYLPKTVFIAYETFNTLPKKEIKSGYAEIIKHSFLAGKKELDEYFFNGPNLSYEVYEFTVNYKEKIVKKDKYDKNTRQFLNFGHTIGHALELKYPNLTHGEAVINGIMFELFLSNKVLKTKYKLDNYKKYFEKNHNYFLLPLEIDALSLSNDKKNKDDKIAFILLKKIGKPKKIYISTSNVDDYIEEYNEYITNSD